MSDEIDFNPFVGAVRGALDTLQPVHTLGAYVKTAIENPGWVALGAAVAMAPHLGPGLAAGLEAVL
ncbi:hypothetical protein LO772_01395 [Yinghuangia sp. ASG 101]|uniref:hypothetical protein n=1 Tax=Yinghuangia sp. ASG 101 TaxID=2896848 RepID=UPI001E395B4F|nr:hypothetical protein [Yinghuangia sp. ASG 101]UGQ12294.1 hypothetical protein LO772_01395 [Yinghuangia sp. ASG 101]